MSFTKYTIDQFMRTTKVLGGAFSSDDQSIVFTTNASGVFNVYSASVHGGPHKQLTHSRTDNTYALSYFPDNQRLLISRDRGGNENYHLCARDVGGGDELDLTPGADVAARFFGPTSDGASFYCATNERDRRCFDIYKINFATLERQLLFANTAGYDFGCVSRDERYVALGEPRTRENSDIFLYDLATKELRCLTTHEGDICFWPSCFDSNSEYLYYRTNRESDFYYVERHELATGTTERIAHDECDCYLNFSPDGKYRIITRDRNSLLQVDITCVASGEPIPLPEFAGESIVGFNFSRSGRLMAFYVDGDRRPGDLYVYDFSSRAAVKLTEGLTPAINPVDLVEAEIIQYPSFDGLEIPALLWKPHNASAAGKAPGLVYVHGGPGGQTRKGYNATIQFLVNRGYIVLAPNYRGSSGYGKTFRALDNGTHAQAPLLDCIAARRYLASLDYVESSKIGILGASYGGFLAISALTFYPEEFAAGVDLFGPTNWQRTLESFPPYWQSSLDDFYRKIGDPRTETEILRKISPLFHAEAITKPLLVLQGARDPRVLKSESDEIVAAIRNTNGVVDYIVFEDEGHGFTKKKNQTRAYQAIVEFLDRHLKTPQKAQVVTTAGSFVG